MNHSCRQSFAQYGSIDKTPMMDYHKLGLISDGGYIMIRCDSHMHSAFSYDSDAEMETMIKSAIDMQLNTICFTEHLDLDYPGDPSQFQIDINAYEKKLFELKDKYKNQIELLYGIELGLVPYLAPRYEQFVQSHPFDYIIGSSHLIDGMDPYYPEFFEKNDTETGIRKYFQTVIDNTKAFEHFMSYGHIDYVVRYAPQTNQGYTYEKYKDILDELLLTLIQHDKALEINTAGFKYGLNQPHPQIDVLCRYREMGGERITIGSDAHKPEHIAFDFARTEEILKHIGFKYYLIFKEQKPVEISL